MNTKALGNQKALITGGDSGMGRAAAIAYAREGADVAINYLPDEEQDAKQVIELIKAEGRVAVAIPGDLRSEAFCQEMVAKAVKDLGEYVNQISTFFSKANPNLPKDAVSALVTEHVKLLKATVDAHAAGDYAMSFQKQHETYNQMGTIADAVSGGIVKQKPELFK